MIPPRPHLSLKPSPLSTTPILSIRGGSMFTGVKSLLQPRKGLKCGLLSSSFLYRAGLYFLHLCDKLMRMRHAWGQGNIMERREHTLAFTFVAKKEHSLEALPLLPTYTPCPCFTFHILTKSHFFHVFSPSAPLLRPAVAGCAPPQAPVQA